MSIKEHKDYYLLFLALEFVLYILFYILILVRTIQAYQVLLSILAFDMSFICSYSCKKNQNLTSLL